MVFLKAFKKQSYPIRCHRANCKEIFASGNEPRKHHKDCLPSAGTFCKTSILYAFAGNIFAFYASALTSLPATYFFSAFRKRLLRRLPYLLHLHDFLPITNCTATYSTTHGWNPSCCHLDLLRHQCLRQPILKIRARNHMQVSMA